MTFSKRLTGRSTDSSSKINCNSGCVRGQLVSSGGEDKILAGILELFKLGVETEVVRKIFRDREGFKEWSRRAYRAGKRRAL